jgi:allantoinase
MMSNFDLVIRHGFVIRGENTGEQDIAVADGKIVAVEPEIEEMARETIDARGLHVFPGVIDAHVHFNEPGRTAWEGWATGTRAFAAGGGTTCFEMPLNAHPPTIDAASFDEKLAAATRQAVSDFGLWGGLVPGNIDQMTDLAERGVVGFKAFMCQSGIDDFPAADDLTLYEGMARAHELNMLVAVHAENDTITAHLTRRAIADGRTGVRDFLESRPVIAELEAISRAILFAEATGCALHIVHVSTGRGVALVTAARVRGVDVTCETCAHYLFFTAEDVEQIGAFAKCAPPIREKPEIDTLWRSIGNGDLLIVTSDHSPSPAQMKQGDDFFRIWGGVSGVQSTLPVVLTAGYAQRGIDLETVARITATNVVRRFALPRKGAIEPGRDADFALVDLGTVFRLSREDLLDRHRLSPYAGRQFRGRVVRTILRGITTWHNGAIVSEAVGRFLRPDPRGRDQVQHSSHMNNDERGRDDSNAVSPDDATAD